jgi:hypothetical protein
VQVALLRQPQGALNRRVRLGRNHPNHQPPSRDRRISAAALQLRAITAANHQRIDTASMAWEPQAPGVDRMALATGIGSHGDGDPGVEISLVRLASGCSLPAAAPGDGLEVLVCDGTWQLSGSDLSKNSFARHAPGTALENTTSTGATLLVRSGPFAASDRDSLQIIFDEQAWREGQGNLRVQPLHSLGDIGTALVHWPAGERFRPHQHWGGEEIFVLSGTFEDEHGQYPTGTWLLSPHLSAHHPFVTEETIIFVKTGHLPQR